MEIKNNYFEYWAYDDKYYISNVNDDSPVRYSLLDLNTNTYITKDFFIAMGDTITVAINNEGYYKIEMKVATGEDFIIPIYHFHISKDTILSEMKNIICDCSSLDGQCSNGEDPMIQDNRDLQFVYTSTNMYKDALLVPEYTRNYICCFQNLIMSDSRLREKLETSLYFLNAEGKLPNNSNFIRLYTTYLYLLFYVIELDFATYVIDTSSNDPVNPDPEPDPIRNGKSAINSSSNEEYIYELFNIVDIKSCALDLNININKVISDLTICYEKYNIGICNSTSPGPGPDPDPTESIIADLMFASPIPPLLLLVGESLTIAGFKWSIVSGLPQNLKLSDGGDQLVDVDVIGTSHDVSLTYTKSAVESITWSVKGMNTNQILLNVDWIHPIYSGTMHIKEQYPTTSGIKSGTIIKTKIDNSFIWEGLVVIPDQYPWVAIPVVSAKLFTKWKDMGESTNLGNIGLNNEYTFIVRKESTVTIDGISYYIYKFGASTNFTNQLKLY